MKKRLLAQLNKQQLRNIVGQVITIKQSKLDKMSKEKCIKKINDLELSYSQLIKLHQ